MIELSEITDLENDALSIEDRAAGLKDQIEEIEFQINNQEEFNRPWRTRARFAKMKKIQELNALNRELKKIRRKLAELKLERSQSIKRDRMAFSNSREKMIHIELKEWVKKTMPMEEYRDLMRDLTIVAESKLKEI